MKALGTGIVIACIAGIISFAAKNLQSFFIMMSGVSSFATGSDPADKCISQRRPSCFY
ncbi:hypothetical protein MGI18_19720 [Bacillus sp. OVS6]|nr:hypothetical protein MGI18_19720 [Bacillus sp. OVS6]